ncbi:MAG: LacI family DNA-binding transcriptional regulator [Anaerolineae bacterium]
MTQKQRGKTLHDVAEIAGVSYQTVSRVVNNHPSVSPDTRARVQAAIRTLGYKPNKLAKSLVGNKSNTLALMTFAINQYGPTQMMLNIERVAKDLGYDLIFSNVSAPSAAQITKALESLSGRQVDGIVAIMPVEGVSYAEMGEMTHGTPMVLIDTQMNADVPSVIVNQRHGSQMVTEHLLTLGHRRIVEISGPLNWYGAQARHQQWQQTMREAGCAADLYVEGDWTPGSGYQAVQHLLAQTQGFTALVVANDQMALGAIHALREHQLRVPQDVSVVGFDDIPEAAYFSPPLTTIRQDFAQLGSSAVHALLERIHDPEVPIRQHIIEPQFVIRHSTAPR